MQTFEDGNRERRFITSSSQLYVPCSSVASSVKILTATRSLGLWNTGDNHNITAEKVKGDEHTRIIFLRARLLPVAQRLDFE